MIDLETLGINNAPVIVSIGAVKFCKAGILNEFYVTVSPQSCMDMGLKMDVSTVIWWMGQSKAAKEVFTAPNFLLQTALLKFNEWFGFGKDYPVWSNGATADLVWLSSAYRHTNIKNPWSFRSERCYRTIRNLFPDIRVPDTGVSHNALDDAKYQALTLIAINEHMEELKNV